MTFNFFACGGSIPDGDTKNLYALGAHLSHSLTTYQVSATGVLAVQAGSPYRIPSSAGKTDLQQTYLWA